MPLWFPAAPFNGNVNGSLVLPTGASVGMANLGTSGSGITFNTNPQILFIGGGSTGAQMTSLSFRIHRAQLLVESGLVGTPAIAASGDPDTGIYWNGLGALAFAINGTLQCDINTTRMLLANELEIDGTLNHDGANVGFFGVAPATRQLVPTGSSSDTIITALQTLGLFRQS